MKKVRVSRRRDVRAYAMFWHTSWCLLEKGRQDTNGSYHQFLASLVFTAFTIEAYLNHVGCILFKSWPEYERSLGPMQKLALLCERVEVTPDYSRRPWQILSQLLPFRNTVAHGKTEVLEKDVVLTIDEQYEEVLHSTLKTDWEKLATLTNVERAREDVRKVVTMIHERARLPEELDIAFMDGGQLGEVTVIDT